MRWPRFARREPIDDLLDRFRFRVDSFPRSKSLRRIAGSHLHYLPLDVLGLHDVDRAEGSVSRWEAMARVVDTLKPAPTTGVDIGANTGYFSLELARRGIAMMALEQEPIAYRTALLAVRRSNMRAQVGVFALSLTPDNLDLVPEADVVVFLSLWHHLVKDIGLDEATFLLERLWQKTRQVMFFDTGENEMPPEFGLPKMIPDGRTWLTAFLGEHCEGGAVEPLGAHQAFDADLRAAERNLFAIRRRQPD